MSSNQRDVSGQTVRSLTSPGRVKPSLDMAVIVTVRPMAPHPEFVKLGIVMGLTGAGRYPRRSVGARPIDEVKRSSASSDLIGRSISGLCGSSLRRR